VEEDGQNNMIVVDGVDGSGKGVQTRRLFQSLVDGGQETILTREPGGSSAAEDIRKLLVEGDPDRWDSMTELLLMYAARRSHLDKTVWPALAAKKWVVCDRYADSSRAFQGIAGKLGLETVEKVHQIVVGSFEPALVLILDIPESIALARAKQRGGGEDRFEKKGPGYHSLVRSAFLQIANSNRNRYQLIDADQTMDQVSIDIIDVVNQHFDLQLRANLGVT
jgi:dTMP kinase